MKGQFHKRILAIQSVFKEYMLKEEFWNIVEEAKKDFPLDMSVWSGWANSKYRETDNPLRKDHAEMIKWFTKWFGDE